MELRLQQFIASVEQLADVRNLDEFNPIVFQMEHPVTAIRYTVVGAKLEPSYLGVPVNTTWVVLDPSSPYYRMALKLVDVNNPDVSTTIPTVNVDVDSSGGPSPGDISLWWNIIRSYDEIFAVPQYYATGSKGPKGDKGDRGDAATVDYNLAVATLAGLTGTLSISGPISVLGNTTNQYSTTIVEAQILPDGTFTAPTPRQVDTPVFIIGQVPAGTYMDTNNVLHTGAISAPTVVKLHATYPSWAKSASCDLNVTLQSTAATVTGVTMTGANSVNSGATSQYTVTAAWSDGSTTNPSAAWALDSASFGTISNNGLLTVPSNIAASGSVNISATVVIGGITYTPNKTVVVTKVAVVSLSSVTVTGAVAVDSGSTAQYTLNAIWSDGSTTHPTATWALNSAAFGTISNTGYLTVPSSIAASGNVTVTATVVINGTTYTPTLVVAVTKVVVVLTVSSVVVAGSAAVYSGATSQYSIDVTWSDSSVTHPSATWGLDSANYGTIDTNGLLTVPSSIAASGTVVVSANLTVNGVVYNPTKSVSVTLQVASAILPFYGTGPALPADWDVFVNGLANRGLTPDNNINIQIDAIGASTYMYVAYPMSYGVSRFYDVISQFYGGWGGAGNAGQGPSAASIAAFNDMPVTANVTVAGVVTPFYIYRTDFANMGAAAGNHWTVSP